MGQGRGKTAGFTLVELMIVVAVIGILAAIAIPRFGEMVEKSREGQTKGNLNSIHSAMMIYYGDQKGIWPTTLNTYVSFAFSQYLDNVNPVKVTGHFVANAINPAGANVAMTANSGTPIGSSTGWLYDSTNGGVYVNSTVKDSRYLPYSFYGFE
ncbi:MAG TPA: prepilin-type N-terminal cleavage/methylation domain-containing protein [bacterium]|nr:prepilin-type N-terminal cleavage/methylation domain-containing protein [bacterium]